MNLHQDVACGALDMDEFTLGRSPVFRGLRPGARAKATTCCLAVSGLTALTDQPRLTRLLIDEYLLTRMGFATVGHGRSPEPIENHPSIILNFA
jgi:hypothetical protein